MSPPPSTAPVIIDAAGSALGRALTARLVERRYASAANGRPVYFWALLALDPQPLDLAAAKILVQRGALSDPAVVAAAIKPGVAAIWCLDDPTGTAFALILAATAQWPKKIRLVTLNPRPGLVAQLDTCTEQIDGRGLDLPHLLDDPADPLGTLLAQRAAIWPYAAQTPVRVGSCESALAQAVKANELTPEAWAGQRTVAIPGIALTLADLAAALGRTINFVPDPAAPPLRPPLSSAAHAESLGFPGDSSLAALLAKLG